MHRHLAHATAATAMLFGAASLQRQPLNPVQYVAELNQRLWADAEFREGMAFRVYPDGRIGGHLRDCSEAGSCGIPAVFARIEAQVAARFEMVALRCREPAMA